MTTSRSPSKDLTDVKKISKTVLRVKKKYLVKGC